MAKDDASFAVLINFCLCSGDAGVKDHKHKAAFTMNDTDNFASARVRVKLRVDDDLKSTLAFRKVQVVLLLNA